MIRNRRSWYDSNSVFSVTVCINRTSSNKTKYTYTNLNSKTCHGNFISHIHHLDKQISHIFGRYCDERGTWEHDETQRINRRAYYSCASFRYHHSAPPGDASLATPIDTHRSLSLVMVSPCCWRTTLWTCAAGELPVCFPPEAGGYPSSTETPGK